MALEATPHARQGESSAVGRGREPGFGNNTLHPDNFSAYVIDPSDPYSSHNNEELSLYDYCNKILERIGELCADSSCGESTRSSLYAVSEHLNHWKSSIYWICTLNEPPSATTEQTTRWLLGEIDVGNTTLSDSIHTYMDDISDALDELTALHITSRDQKDLVALLSVLEKDLDTACQCLGQQLVPIRAFAGTVRFPEEYRNLMQSMYLNRVEVPSLPSLYTDGGSSIRDSVSTRMTTSSRSYSEHSASKEPLSGGTRRLHITQWNPMTEKDYDGSYRPSGLATIPSYFQSHYGAPTEYPNTGLSSSLSSEVTNIIRDSALGHSGDTAPPLRKRIASRTQAPAKDHYKTCVSRKQRARRSESVAKYFCTMCREPFFEKADWKRHEEVFQERPDEFQCDMCSNKYFLDKDFVYHHAATHGCVPCNARTKILLKKHAQEARRPRKTRTGWGCGFCYHFSSHWIDRCNHVAHHFDIEGKTMIDWNHSSVIYSLLQRPEIRSAWDTILENKQRAFRGFGWDPMTTGRVEGYPDSTQVSQLQDTLEYFTPGTDTVALAREAFDLAVLQVKRSPATGPPVPLKDSKKTTSGPEAGLQDIMEESESWKDLVRSIIDDDDPIGVTHPESGAFGDSQFMVR